MPIVWEQLKLYIKKTLKLSLYLKLKINCVVMNSVVLYTSKACISPIQKDHSYHL